MTFDEWYRTQEHQLSNKQVCGVIWDAAIESAAKVVGSRGRLIGGAVDPEITVKVIRALSSNAALSGWPGKDEKEAQK